MADVDAIEVRENNRLAPRYGMNQLSFRELVEKEQRVAQLCQEIIKNGEYPLQIKGLLDYGILEENEELQDFFVVLTKVCELLEAGFHVLIVRSMLGCACGEKSGPGDGFDSSFDEKFSSAFTDVEVRKDFWGTEHLFPIQVVNAFSYCRNIFFC